MHAAGNVLHHCSVPLGWAVDRAHQDEQFGINNIGLRLKIEVVSGPELWVSKEAKVSNFGVFGSRRFEEPTVDWVNGSHRD